jgi:hypothetical protein
MYIILGPFLQIITNVYGIILIIWGLGPLRILQNHYHEVSISPQDTSQTVKKEF